MITFSLYNRIKFVEARCGRVGRGAAMRGDARQGKVFINEQNLRIVSIEWSEM